MLQAPAHLHRIELLAARHVPGTGRVLRQAFPDGVLAAMGRGFLERLLRSFASGQNGFGYVCLCRGEVVGFVVGAENIARHRSTLVRHEWAPLTIHALMRLVMSPSLAWRLARYLVPHLSSLPGRIIRTRDRSEQQSIPPASLVLLAVAEEHRRHGIADRLTHAFLDEMTHRRVESVKLAVAASNEPALTFYRSRGWQDAGLYPAPEGGPVYRLVYELDSSHRSRERNCVERLLRVG